MYLKELRGSDVPLIDYALIYVEDDLSEYGKFELGIAMDSYADAYRHGEGQNFWFP